MIYDFENYSDERGDLTVLEKIIPFEIKRIYFLHNTNRKDRGFHYHKKNIQMALAIKGSCKMNFKHGENTKSYLLNNPNKGILIDKLQYHWMSEFSDDCILLVLASEHYDANDYFS